MDLCRYQRRKDSVIKTDTTEMLFSAHEKVPFSRKAERDPV